MSHPRGAAAPCPRPSGKKVGRPELQQFAGATNDRAWSRLFFAYGKDLAAIPYSLTAISYADESDIALFVYDKSGEIAPLNDAAQRFTIADLDTRARAHSAAKAREALHQERRSTKARSGSSCSCGGKFVTRRRRRDGKRFLGCTNYPRCSETRPAR